MVIPPRRSTVLSGGCSRGWTRATVATREWWTKFLKGAASFRGVKIGDLRTALHAWFEDERLEEHLSVGQRNNLALMLLEEDYTEDKLAGVLFLQEILLPAGSLDWRSDLPRFARLFDEGYIVVAGRGADDQPPDARVRAAAGREDVHRPDDVVLVRALGRRDRRVHDEPRVDDGVDLG